MTCFTHSGCSVTVDRCRIPAGPGKRSVFIVTIRCSCSLLLYTDRSPFVIITITQSFLQPPKLPRLPWYSSIAVCGDISCVCVTPACHVCYHIIKRMPPFPLCISPCGSLCLCTPSAFLQLCGFVCRACWRKESVIISHLRLCFAVISEQLECWMELRLLL